MSGLSMDQLGALGQSKPTYTTIRTKNPVSEWLRANLPFLRAERSYMTRRFRDVTPEELSRMQAAGRARQRVADAKISRVLLNRKLIARAASRRGAASRSGSWAAASARAEVASRRDLARALASRRRPRAVPPTPRGVKPARVFAPSPSAVAAASARELAVAEARARRPVTQQARQATMARSGVTTGRGMPAAVISYFQFQPGS